MDDLGSSGLLVLGHARRVAATHGASALGSEHLFLGIAELGDASIRTSLHNAGVDLERVAVELAATLGHSATPDGRALRFTSDAHAALEAAVAEAVRQGQRRVEAAHILVGVLRVEHGPLVDLFRKLGVDPGAVADRVSGLIESGETTPADFYRPRRTVEQAEVARPADVLESLGRDLTAAADRGELSPIIGRQRETDELVTVLLGKRKNNAILIGDPGVGKTAVVEGLAQRIVAGEVPPLAGTRIRTIEVGSLVAGTIYRGQFEQRLKDLVDSVRDRDDIILFIDEMHMLVGAGETGGGSMDAANILKPVLSEGALKVVGATTIDEYRKYLEKDKALMRRFQPVVVGEPSREEALVILQGLQPRYEAFHMVDIQTPALEAAIDISLRYIHDRHLPDKALDLLDRACTTRKLAGAAGNGRAQVTADDVAEVASVLLEIPIARLSGAERDHLAHLDEALAQRVVGQDHVIAAVAPAILRSRVGFGSATRPVGVFLFLGPTGVGKTKFAEELARFLFGTREALLAFDMSQYTDPTAVNELIGSKPGFVGWEEGGKLTNAVRARPYSVVLLDEFEKAHPVVWNLMLPIFENGRMTDPLGRVVDFRSTVIILTSNVGATRFVSRPAIGFRSDDGTDAAEPEFASVARDVVAEARQVFPLELVNRMDEVIVFRSLTRDTVRQIVLSRLADTVPVHLDLTDAALELLVDHSFDPAMGARPVRRAIQRLVANPLSLLVAKGQLAEGDSVAVDVDESGAALAFLRTGA